VRSTASVDVLNYPRRVTNMVGRLIWWMLVGLIAAWLAGKVTKVGGYCIAVDIVVGIVVAVTGALFFRRIANFPFCGLVHGELLKLRCNWRLIQASTVFLPSITTEACRRAADIRFGRAPSSSGVRSILVIVNLEIEKLRLQVRRRPE
jgi:uncharacterized membrane protein YeaQ/YmgE (transglycosylase-associated protein family)